MSDAKLEGIHMKFINTILLNIIINVSYIFFIQIRFSCNM